MIISTKQRWTRMYYKRGSNQVNSDEHVRYKYMRAKKLAEKEQGTESERGGAKLRERKTCSLEWI
jgi:hypothetical protein